MWGTYGEEAVLFAVLSDLLLGDGRRLGCVLCGLRDNSGTVALSGGRDGLRGDVLGWWRGCEIGHSGRE